MKGRFVRSVEDCYLDIFGRHTRALVEATVWEDMDPLISDQ